MPIDPNDDYVCVSVAVFDDDGNTESMVLKRDIHAVCDAYATTAEVHTSASGRTQIGGFVAVMPTERFAETAIAPVDAPTIH